MDGGQYQAGDGGGGGYYAHPPPSPDAATAIVAAFAWALQMTLTRGPSLLLAMLWNPVDLLLLLVVAYYIFRIVTSVAWDLFSVFFWVSVVSLAVFVVARVGQAGPPDLMGGVPRVNSTIESTIAYARTSQTHTFIEYMTEQARDFLKALAKKA